MVSQIASKYIKSSHRALTLLNQPCLTLTKLNQIHSHLTVSGYISDPYAAGKLVSLYTNSNLPHAYTLFDKLSHRTTFMWNTMIQAFLDKKEFVSALSLYKTMIASNFMPNNRTFSFVLRACADICDCELGLIYHCQVVKLGWESYDFVLNGLVNLYAICNRMECARRLFDDSLNKDVITWTSLVYGYAKNGQVEVARQLFDEMPIRNSVSWSAMISGYGQVGMYEEALEVFNDMLVEGFRPNHAAVVVALSACGFLGALDQGRWIHAYVEKNKMVMDVVLGSAFIDMYAKCGCVETAYRVFEEMPCRDVFAYTSLISGLANHGESARAVKLLLRMREEGIRPNEVAFICALNACSRKGLVEEGLRIFESMKRDYGIEPGVQHYGCLVDLLGGAGMLDEAKKVISEMPMDPDSYVLGALLNACSVHGDVDLGKEMVESLAERSLDKSGVHVLLSNMHASANQWDEVERVRTRMGEKKVKKVPGCSLIEVDGVVCEFVAGDKSHKFKEEIELLLQKIDKHLKSLWLDVDNDTIMHLQMA